MRDAVTSLIKKYDLAGRYLDRDAMDSLKSYFNTGIQRIRVVNTINLNSVDIVKSAASRLFSELPDLIRPGGNAYTTRRYATCLRDMDYYLRYATYALVAGDTSVLDERVLAGLRETYNSLGVPIAPTVMGIQNMKDRVMELLGSTDDYRFVAEPFEYMGSQLSETDI
ncbi:MAG: allophycocyanin subunit beta [Cyanobacteriota bacterium]|nr:allophycocyanin subunit beta [Cyanobacteriota bacterium]